MNIGKLVLGFGLSLGVLLAQAVMAIDKSEVLTNQDYRRHDLMISVEVAHIIEAEGQVAMDDPRVHCERTRKRGSYLRRTYCQTQAEHFWEQTYTETARAAGRAWSSRPYFPAYQRSNTKPLQLYRDGID